MLNITKIIMTAVSVVFLSGYFSFADTVIMKSRERIKGVVVEDYADRVVISTADGERELSKDSINRIIYDLEEQNLTSLGDFYQDRGMYKTALYYYEQALQANPDYRQAREGRNYSATFLQQADRIRKMEHVQRMNEERLWRQGDFSDAGPSDQDRLRQILGITLKDTGGSFEIIEVMRGSPADEAGLKRGDTILSAWGRNITYMRPEEVIKRLISPEVMEVRMSVRRSVMLDLEGARGNFSAMTGLQTEYSEMEGLMVSGVHPESPATRAGMKEGDFILSVQGESTRYMPMSDMENIVRGRRGETLSFEIKRDIVIWKKIEDR